MKKTAPFCVLLIGSYDDPQIELIYKKITQKNLAEVVVLDFNRSHFTFSLDRNGKFSLNVENISIPSSAAVYDRTMFRKGTNFYPKGKQCEADFTADQYMSTFRLLNTIFDKKVINPFWATSRMTKPFQQIMAANSGFLVPNTIVSNVKSDIIKFTKNSDDNFIIKPIGNPSLIDENVQTSSRVIMTNRVDRELLSSQSEQNIAYCPSFIQEEIQKLFELRVISINKRNFAFHINSQEKSLSQTDWRRQSESLTYSIFEITEDLNNKINLFMNKSSLFAGHIDLIVDCNMDIWFLECNGQGAWVWLDNIVNGQISNAFIEELVNLSKL